MSSKFNAESMPFACLVLPIITHLETHIFMVIVIDVKYEMQNVVNRHKHKDHFYKIVNPKSAVIERHCQVINQCQHLTG